VNIPGFAYFGREPYSTWIASAPYAVPTLLQNLGAPHFQVRRRCNLVQLRSTKAQIFELVSAVDVNFGGLAASHFFPVWIRPPSGLDRRASYGLGIPTTYIKARQFESAVDNPFCFRPGFVAN